MGLEATPELEPLKAHRLNGTQIVFSLLVTTPRSSRNAEDLFEVHGETVVVTVKQYLAVADDVLRKLFPEFPPSFWAQTGQYPTCRVFISEHEHDTTRKRI